MDGKNEVFQRLKPPAVALSQALISIEPSRNDVRTVQERLEKLCATVQSIVSSNSYFDEKLADYVFFPVSQVLRASKTVSIQCLETSLAIIAILIRQGWRSRIQQELAQQLLILCTLCAGDNPSIANTDQTTPELQSYAMECLNELLIVLAASTTSVSLFTNAAYVPQLGQAISTLLQATHKSPSPAVQESAIKVLCTISEMTLPAQVVLGFLPGVVSTLTKVLTTQAAQRRRSNILVSSLTILKHMIKSVFEDDRTRAQRQPMKDVEDTHGSGALRSAVPQIKLALVNIVRLQDHDRHEVRMALGRLCMTILRHCRRSLEDCNQLALETMLSLSSDTSANELRFEVILLMSTDPKLLAIVQATLFDWSQSLVRIMQASNEDAKKQRLQQIGCAYQCLIEAGNDPMTTNQVLAQVLKDCVVLSLQDAPNVQPSTALHTTALVISSSEAELVDVGDFAALTTNSSKISVLRSIQEVVELICTNDVSHSVLDSLVGTLATSRGDNLIAVLVLSLQYLRKSMQESDDFDAFIDAGDSRESHEAHIEALYSFALSYLAQPTSEQSPLVSSLTLQALALRAQTAGPEFKIELIDALYPVLHSLATPQQTIQHDSMVVLNTFTRSCGYTSVMELIVDNVDYLTNAVALKLNSFDVSPQAPQVLLMMVRLAGPRLVPYLEDIIDSMFAALEDYHGYPLLVELLFKTLSVVAQEGSKAPLLDARVDVPLLEVHRGLEAWEPATIADLSDLIRGRCRSPTIQESFVREPAPQEPWTSEPEPASQVQQPIEDKVDLPPVPKTYNILVRITELTQHFLPSASPSLRISLLSLIRTTVPSIARHENTFLPLINTLWPEIVSRLDDEEPTIRAATLEIITILCRHAKDFMRSRITELWPRVREVWLDIVKEISNSVATPKSRAKTGDNMLVQLSDQSKRDIQRIQNAPEDYSNVSARTMWQAIIRMLTVIVGSVPIPPELFDEALEMVQPVLKEPDVLVAFERENADAVWLKRLKSGEVKLQWQPKATMGFVRVH